MSSMGGVYIQVEGPHPTDVEVRLTKEYAEDEYLADAHADSQEEEQPTPEPDVD